MMHIDTTRLIIDPVLKKDLKDIHNLLTLPETDQYNALGIPQYQKESAAHLEGWISDMKATPITNYTLAIRLQSDKTFIGLLGIKVAPEKYRSAELWYKIHKDHWNKGYATEAAKSTIDYCFLKLDLHRIEAGAATANLASIKVFEKLGMTKEGVKRKVLPLKNGFADSAIYGLLRSEHY